MDKHSIINTIKSERSYLHDKFGVEEIALFGSYARGEQNKDSDIDLLVKLNKKTLRNYIGFIDYLQDKLKSKIDVVTKHDHLSSKFMNLVGKDLIYV